MSGGWIDVHSPAGVRREALREGLTRLGGSGAEIVLAAAGEDQLQFWNRPPRVVFLGRGPRPVFAGAGFDERALRPGDRILWAGCELVYGGEAGADDLAPLEELPLRDAASSGRAVPPERVTRRVLAGLACDLGLAERQAMQRWQQAVLQERFDADACARELLPAPLGPEVEARLDERAGRLLRDFLMAAYLSGLRGASRKARETTRGILAFLVAQGLALGLFVLIVLATMLLLRARGTSFDRLLDRILPG